MRKVEFRRWKDFSLRMAAKSFRITPRRKVRLLKEIHFMFDDINDGQYGDHDENWRKLSSWDDDFKGVCFCDWFNVRFEEYDCWDNNGIRNTKFSSMLHCCVRAGLDIASVQSGGVLGFSKSDIERMYPRGVPAWIRSNWSKPWKKISSDAGLWL